MKRITFFKGAQFKGFRKVLKLGLSSLTLFLISWSLYAQPGCNDDLAVKHIQRDINVNPNLIIGNNSDFTSGTGNWQFFEGCLDPADRSVDWHNNDDHIALYGPHDLSNCTMLQLDAGIRPFDMMQLDYDVPSNVDLTNTHTISLRCRTDFAGCSTPPVVGCLPPGPEYEYTVPSPVVTIQLQGQSASGLNIVGAQNIFRFSTSQAGPNDWEEFAFFFKMPPGVDRVRIRILNSTRDTPYDEELLAYIDDIYLGRGRGFDDEPTCKVPFDGKNIKVDELGNVFTKNTDGSEDWFFPAIIHGDNHREIYGGGWEVYHNKGFNAIVTGNDTSQIKDAIDANLKVVRHLGDYYARCRDVPCAASNIDCAPFIQELEARLDYMAGTPDGNGNTYLDHLLFHFIDNEVPHKWNEMKKVTEAVKAWEANHLGITGSSFNRIAPIDILNGTPGIAPKYLQDGGCQVGDITGTYISPGDEDPTNHRWTTLDHQNNQSMPTVIAQINGNDAVRARVLGAIAQGARGMNFWRDNSPGNPCYMPPNCTDGACINITDNPKMFDHLDGNGGETIDNDDDGVIIDDILDCLMVDPTFIQEPNSDAPVLPYDGACLDAEGNYMSGCIRPDNYPAVYDYLDDPNTPQDESLTDDDNDGVIYGDILNQFLVDGRYIETNDITQTDWWGTFPALIGQINAMSKLIQTPHWTNDWSVKTCTNNGGDCDDNTIAYGTRELVNDDGVLEYYLIVANYGQNDVTNLQFTFASTTADGLPFNNPGIILMDEDFEESDVIETSSTDDSFTFPVFLAEGAEVYKIIDGGCPEDVEINYYKDQFVENGVTQAISLVDTETPTGWTLTNGLLQLRVVTNPLAPINGANDFEDLTVQVVNPNGDLLTPNLIDVTLLGNFLAIMTYDIPNALSTGNPNSWAVVFTDENPAPGGYRIGHTRLTYTPVTMVAENVTMAQSNNLVIKTDNYASPGNSYLLNAIPITQDDVVLSDIALTIRFRPVTASCEADIEFRLIDPNGNPLTFNPYNPGDCTIAMNVWTTFTVLVPDVTVTDASATNGWEITFIDTDLQNSWWQYVVDGAEISYDELDASCLDGSSNLVNNPSNFVIDDINDEIETPQDKAMSVYPVPATNTLNIDYNSNNTSPLFIEVMSNDGKVLISHKDTKITEGLNTLQLNIEQLPTGYYFIRAYNGNSLPQVQSFVKMNPQTK